MSHPLDALTDWEVIGRGGFATVYRARQESMARHVAVKILNSRDLDADELRRFRNECQTMGALGAHPNIVSVFDAGTTKDGNPYLVMQYVPDGSLATGLTPPQLDLAVALDLGVQIAGALETAHRSGVLHRDVKPANILRGPAGAYLLSDFGIAALQDGTQTTTGAMVGTVAYLAPEVLNGERSSARSDVYALGTTLHAVISGKPPFGRLTDETPAASMRRVLFGEVTELTEYGVPEAVSDVIQSAMATEPSRRYSSAMEFGGALIDLQRRLGSDASRLTVLDLGPIAASPGRSGQAVVPEPGLKFEMSQAAGTVIRPELKNEDVAVHGLPDVSVRQRPTKLVGALAVLALIAAAAGGYALTSRSGGVESSPEAGDGVDNPPTGTSSAADADIAADDSGADEPAAGDPADGDESADVVGGDAAERVGDGPECAVDEVDGDLFLYNWAGYIDPDLLTAFEEQYGVSVTQDTYDSNEAMQGIISAGNSGYDVIVPSDYMVSIMIENGDVMALDKAAIPNYSNLADDFESGLSYDPEGAYAAPYQWGTTGLGVDKAVTGEDFPRSWALVFDQATADEFGTAGSISLLNDPRETLGAALKYLGYSLNSTSEDELNEAKELVANAPVQAFDSGGYVERLMSAEIGAAHGYSGNFFVGFFGQPEPSRFTYFVPDEGGTRWVDNMAVVHDAPHPCTAHTFINFILDAENGATLTNWNYYASPNEAAEASILPEILEDPAIYPTDTSRLEIITGTGDYETDFSDAFIEAKG